MNMPPTKLVSYVVRVCLGLASFAVAATAHAQATTGTIEGRVLNADNGRYLGNARVTVTGTSLETLTDSTGTYRLGGVPAGSAVLRVFYTGLNTQDATIAVGAGQTVSHDVSLTAGNAKEGEVIKLDAFKVAAKVEMDAASIAINEQRFATTIKNVVSTDAFGDITEGNVGDFVKFLPGVTIDYVSPDARTISVRGVPPNYTPVTLNGNRIASASSSSKSRTFELEQVSINNAGRVEVLKSRSPETAADSLGGAVNLVPRSAFEQSKPSFSYRAFLSGNGDEKEWSKTRGPGSASSRKIKPGFDFVYIDPISKNLGLTFAVLESNIFYPQHRSQPNYAPNTAVAVSPAAGVAGPVASPENPYLRNYQVQDGPKNNHRSSVSGSLDWRISPIDVISVGAQWNYYDAFFGNRPVTYNVGGTAPTDFSDDFVNGAPGKGSVVLGGTSFRRKYGFTYATDTTYKHNGPVWQIDGGLGFSHASNHYHDEQNGFINPTLTLRGNPSSPAASSPTVIYNGIRAGSYLMPTKITVLNTAGILPVDISDLSNYNITSASFAPLDSADVFKTARLNAKRDLGLSVPISIKVGAQVQEETRDIKGDNRGAYTFVGPDGLANTLDDNAGRYDIADPQYATRPFILNTPQVPFPDPSRVYQLYKNHPEYWALANVANPVTLPANASAYFREVISAAYVMGDAKLMDNRLRVSGGMRFERTQDQGAGVKFTPADGYITNSSGQRVLNPDLVARAKAQYKDRGEKRSLSYDGYYPSLDASYNLTHDLIARFGYAKSIGRQDLPNIIPSTQLPDLTVAGPYTITTINSSLEPTKTNSYDLSLEYYFSKTGVVSLGLFRKDFSNFVGSSVAQPATLDLLNELGVADAQTYVNAGALVSTAFNVGSARVTGVEFNYSQVLDSEYLPAWTRSFTVYANGQQMHLEGSTLADFSNFIPASGSWGVKYGSGKFSAQVNWNYRGRQRLTQSSITYAGVAHTDNGFFTYYKPRIYTDVNFAYRYNERLGLFINARNLTNVAQDSQTYGPTSPSWSRTNRREEFGVQYTVGVKGSF